MKKNLFEITEQEKNRILNMHINATNRHYIFEQVAQAPVDMVLGNQGQPVVGAQPAPQSLVNTPQQTAPQQPAPQQPAAQQPAAQQPAAQQPAAQQPAAQQPPAQQPADSDVKIINNLPGDPYEYKKQGDKYYFKLKSNPKSEKAKNLLKSGKYVNWTEATGGGLKYIKKLDWSKSEKLNLQTTPLSDLRVQNQTLATGQNQTQKLVDPVGDAQKVMPNIKNIDVTKQQQVAAWAKSPAGQYILSLPQEQREAGLDLLEKRNQDQTTRSLKNEIRLALGMKADNIFGRLGQGFQGFKQGYQGGQTA